MIALASRHPDGDAAQCWSKVERLACVLPQFLCWIAVDTLVVVVTFLVSFAGG